MPAQKKTNACEITELKRQLARESALRRVAEQSLARYQDSAIAGLYRTTLDGQFLRATPVLARILGYDSPQDLMESVTDIANQIFADPAARDEHIRACLESNRPERRTLEMHCRDGKPIHVLMDRQVVRDRNGQPLFFEGMMVDMTKRKQAEKAVHAQYQFVQSLIDALPNPLFYKDENGIYLGCNKAFSDMLGLPVEEIVGKTGTNVFPDSVKKAVHQGDERFYAAPAVSKQEIEMPFADGSSRWLYVNRAPIVIDDRFTGQVGVNTDITQIKSIQYELTKLKRAVEQSPVSIVITDRTGTIEYVNPYFCSLTGYSLEEAVGATPHLLNSGTHSPDFYKEMWETISSGRKWRGKFSNRKKTGEPYWEQSIISPVKNEVGDITNYIAVKEDITQRILDEQRLQKSENRYRRVVEETDNLILRVDEQGKLLFLNKTAQAMFGYENRACLGHSIFAFVHPEDREHAMTSFAKWQRRKNRNVTYVNRFLDHAENVRHLSWNIRLNYDDEGNLQSVNAIGTDVTQEKTLKLLREDVERITRHDLKSPLMGMISVPQVLLTADNLTDAQRSLLRAAEDSGYRMLQMINLSLDLYKVETGSYVLNPTPVDLVMVVGKVIREISKIATPLRVETMIHTIPDSCGQVKAYGEELLCHSMLSNLIANAVEASPKQGQVTVTIHDKNPVRVDIHNLKPVDKTVRENFFSKYVTHGKANGTGLGTYSARLMAEVQNGTITMRTSSKNGTTVTVTLPRVPGS